MKHGNTVDFYHNPTPRQIARICFGTEVKRAKGSEVNLECVWAGIVDGDGVADGAPNPPMVETNPKRLSVFVDQIHGISRPGFSGNEEGFTLAECGLRQSD